MARMGGKRGMYRVLVEEPEGRRSRFRWEDNIKMYLQGVGRGRHGLN